MGVAVTGNVSLMEGKAYVDYLERKYNRKLKSWMSQLTAIMPI